jgi:hypothetical protein
MFQLAQQQNPSTVGRQGINNLDGILPEQSYIAPIAGAVKKVADRALEAQFNTEIQKKQMEAEQELAAGKTVEEFRNGESWLNTIFGKSAKLETAIGLQAEASYYNGYSDIMTKMGDYSKVKPEEFSKFVADTYSGYLTGDPEVDSIIRERTRQSRDSLMKAHAANHQKFIQEQSLKSTIDLVRAKQSAYAVALDNERMFGTQESFEGVYKEQVKDLAGFYHTIAKLGDNEANVVANQVLNQLNVGDASGFEAIKGSMGLFSQQDEMRLNNGYQSYLSAKQRDEKLISEQAPARHKGLIKAALNQALKQPIADTSILWEQVDAATRDGFLSESEAKTYVANIAELDMKQADWEIGLTEAASGKPVTIEPFEVDDAIAYTFNRIDSIVSDKEQVRGLKNNIRNTFPVSSAYQKQLTRDLEELVIGDKPNPRAVDSIRQLMELQEQGGREYFALRQLSDEKLKAKYLSITEQVRSRLSNTGQAVDLTAAINDSVFYVDMTSKAGEGGNISTPKPYALAYKDDPKQFKEDVNTIKSYLGDSGADYDEKSPAFMTEMVRFRKELELFGNRNPTVPLKDARVIVSQKLADKTFDGVTGLTQGAVAGMGAMAVRRGETTQEQVEAYLDFRRKSEGLEWTENNDLVYSENGNFILFEKDDNNVRTGRMITVPAKDVASVWTLSKTYQKRLHDDRVAIYEQRLKQGLEVGEKPVYEPLDVDPALVGKVAGGDGLLDIYMNYLKGLDSTVGQVVFSEESFISPASKMYMDYLKRLGVAAGEAADSIPQLIAKAYEAYSMTQNEATKNDIEKQGGGNEPSRSGE